MLKIQEIAEQLDEAIRDAESLLTGLRTARQSLPPGNGRVKKRGRKWTSPQREAHSMAMKKYWEQRAGPRFTPAQRRQRSEAMKVSWARRKGLIS